MVLKDFVYLWNVFLDQICEDKEVMVNTVHLEFIAIVNDVPTEKIYETDKCLLLSHVKHQRST